MKLLSYGLRPRCGFSLAETLISTSIISSALLAVLGLLSSGMKVSQESTATTAAGVLAHRVADELTWTLPATSTTATTATASTSALTKTVKVFDRNLQPLPTYDDTPAGTVYQNGCKDMAASYIVTWTLSPRTDVGKTAQQIKVQVESPASVPQANRSRMIYATLLSH